MLNEKRRSTADSKIHTFDASLEINSSTKTFVSCLAADSFLMRFFFGIVFAIAFSFLFTLGDTSPKTPPQAPADLQIARPGYTGIKRSDVINAFKSFKMDSFEHAFSPVKIQPNVPGVVILKDANSALFLSLVGPKDDLKFIALGIPVSDLMKVDDSDNSDAKAWVRCVGLPRRLNQIAVEPQESSGWEYAAFEVFRHSIRTQHPECQSLKKICRKIG